MVEYNNERSNSTCERQIGIVWSQSQCTGSRKKWQCHGGYIYTCLVSAGHGYVGDDQEAAWCWDGGSLFARDCFAWWWRCGEVEERDRGSCLIYRHSIGRRRHVVAEKKIVLASCLQECVAARNWRTSITNWKQLASSELCYDDMNMHACLYLALILSPSSFLSTIFWVTVKQVLYIYSAPNYINWWIAQLTVYNKSSLIFFILTVATSKCTCIRKRTCSLVVTKASVASEVLCSTPHGSEYSRI